MHTKFLLLFPYLDPTPQETVSHSRLVIIGCTIWWQISLLYINILSPEWTIKNNWAGVSLLKPYHWIFNNLQNTWSHWLFTIVKDIWILNYWLVIICCTIWWLTSFLYTSIFRMNNKNNSIWAGVSLLKLYHWIFNNWQNTCSIWFLLFLL